MGHDPVLACGFSSASGLGEKMLCSRRVFLAIGQCAAGSLSQAAGLWFLTVAFAAWLPGLMEAAEASDSSLGWPCWLCLCLLPCPSPCSGEQ